MLELALYVREENICSIIVYPYLAFGIWYVTKNSEATGKFPINMRGFPLIVGIFPLKHVLIVPTYL